MRDLNTLQRKASAYGDHVGAYPERFHDAIDEIVEIAASESLAKFAAWQDSPPRRATVGRKSPTVEPPFAIPRAAAYPADGATPFRWGTRGQLLCVADTADPSQMSGSGSA